MPAVALVVAGLLSGPAPQAVATPVNPFVYYVAADGGLWSYSQTASGSWTTAARIGPGGVAPPGAHVTAVRLPGGQPSAFFVGLNGSVYQACPQSPQPFAITAAGSATPGGPVAAGLNGGQIALFTDTSGWYNGAGPGPYGPLPTPPPSSAEISNPCSPPPVVWALAGTLTGYVPGGNIATAQLPGNAYGVFTADGYGQVRVQWHLPTGAVTEQQLTAANSVLPGAPLAVTPTLDPANGFTTLTLFFAAPDGRVRALRVTPGGGPVGSPVPNTTGPADVPSGAALAVSTGTGGISVGYAANNGAFTLARLSSAGTWLRTDAVSSAGYVTPGSSAAATAGPASDDDGFWHCGNELHYLVHIHIPIGWTEPPPKPNWEIGGPQNVAPGASFATA